MIKQEDGASNARKEEWSAKRALDAITAAASIAGRVAAAAEEDAYKQAHDYSGARQRLADAVAARIAAEDALPAHEWEGQLVFRIENIYPQYGRGVVGNKRVDGIVETVRSTSPFPANKSYGLPRPGEVIVRLLKKDGTPALKFEPLKPLFGNSTWQLASAIEARSDKTRSGLAEGESAACKAGDAK